MESNYYFYPFCFKCYYSTGWTSSSLLLFFHRNCCCIRLLFPSSSYRRWKTQRMYQDIRLLSRTRVKKMMMKMKHKEGNSLWVNITMVVTKANASRPLVSARSPTILLLVIHVTMVIATNLYYVQMDTRHTLLRTRLLFILTVIISSILHAVQEHYHPTQK